jgi:hypothetical protein
VLFDNIKESDDENTDELVIEQIVIAGIHISPGELNISHRLGVNKPGKPRAIIARFTSARTATNVIMAIKRQNKSKLEKAKQQRGQMNQLSTTPEPMVRAREHLSAKRADLLSRCIRHKLNNLLHSCWIYNYKVFVRKSESDRKGTVIESVAALDNLIMN